MQVGVPILIQAVEERKKWARFGDALKAGEQQSVTAQSTDEIPFERVRQQKQTQEERKQDLKNVLQGSDKGAIVSKYISTLRPLILASNFIFKKEGIILKKLICLSACY